MFPADSMRFQDLSGLFLYFLYKSTRFIVSLVMASGSVTEIRSRRKDRLIRAALTGILSKGIHIGVQVILVAILIRYLGNSRYGLWATVSEVVAWISIANLGLGHSLTTRLAACHGTARKEESERAISSTIFMVLVITAPLLVLSFLAGQYVPWNSLLNVSGAIPYSEITATITLGLFMSAVLLLGNTSSAILQGNQRGDIVNASQTVGTIIGFFCVSVGSFCGAGITILLFLFFSPKIFVVFAQFYIAKKNDIFHFSWLAVHFTEARRLLVLGGQFFFLQMSVIIVQQSGALLIASQFGLEEVAPYAVTNRMVMAVLTFIGALTTPLWPALGDAYGRGDISWMRSAFRNAMGLVIVVWLLFACVAFTLGQNIMEIWVGKDAVPSMELLGTMSVLALFASVSMVTTFLLNGIGELRSQMVGQTLTALFYIPLALFLCRRIGIAGVPGSYLLLLLFVNLPLTLTHVRRVLYREPVKHL